MEAADSIYDETVAMLRRFAPAFLPEQDNIPQIANAARRVCLAGGSTLFHKGEPSDTIYFVLSGLFGVCIETAGGAEKMVRRLGPGEILGEMGCITGEPRSATVRALRSSELLAISWSDIEHIARKDPHILLSFCRTLVQRLSQAQTEQGRAPSFRPHSFALIAISDGVDLRSFGERFKAALGLVGSTFLVTRDECQGMTTGELFQLETTHEHVVYVAEQDGQTWPKLCLSQADVILMVARADRPPQPILDTKEVARPGIPLALMLVWDSDIQPAKASEWIKATGASRHFHIRGSPDMRRATRLLTGRGLGLVLSGGGARGAAHIGVARALHEHGIDIDVVMGTSIGALIGAGIALEWDPAYMTEKAHKFCQAYQFLEITFPRLSLLAGRNIRRSVRRWFGNLQIEDTPIPYSCVSTNLSTAQAIVHQSGSLQVWTRASAAVPGVFPPVVVDGVVHVDGGVLNNMPSDLIRHSGAGFVLGVDVGQGAIPAEIDMSGSLSSRMPLNILELLIRVGCVGDEARWGLRRQQCDVLIIPPLAKYGLLKFRAYQQILEIGYRSALEVLPALAARKAERVSEAPVSPEL